jgi:hypothetical protein
MSDDSKKILLQILKAIGILIAVLLLLIVLGFGLLVGFCALGSRH